MKETKREDDKNTDQDQGRATFHPGSTTQGGSDHGQGSSQLGGGSYRQGSEKNAGADAENEEGKLGDQKEQDQ